MTTSDSRAYWDRLEVSTSKKSMRFGVNADSRLAMVGTIETEGVFLDITSTADPMGAGEFLDFCSVGAVVADVEVSLRDAATGSMVGEWVFATVGPCL